MINIAKNRRFPENEYEIYELNKNSLGRFLNIWFVGRVIKYSDLSKNKVKIKRGTLTDFVCVDEMWTVKKVDDHTANHLYCRKYNPISITILCPTGAKFPKNEKGEDLYNMKAMVHSIDDSSYGVWFNAVPLETLKQIRLELMKIISLTPIINGDDFITMCLGWGADKESIDYN